SFSRSRSTSTHCAALCCPRSLDASPSFSLLYLPARWREDKMGKLRVRTGGLRVAAGIGIGALISAATVLAEEAAAPAPKFDTGDTAWMLTSSALVLMMTVPGLALFYGGLV